MEFRFAVRPNNLGTLYHVSIYFRANFEDDWNYANSLCLTTEAYGVFLSRFSGVEVREMKATLVY